MIRFSSIGDIVLASPVLRCLKKQLPDAEVHFLTKSSFRIVSESNPNIDKFYYYDNNLSVLIEELKTEQYDYVVDLHNNLRSNKIRRALKKKTYTIDKLNVQKFLLTKLNIDITPDVHITQRSLNTVLPLNVTDDGLGLDYYIPPGDVVRQEDIPTSHSAGFIAVVIGGSYFTNVPYHLRAHLRVGMQIGSFPKPFYLYLAGFYYPVADELAFFCQSFR